jgi:hypothetical protein
MPAGDRSIDSIQPKDIKLVESSQHESRSQPEETIDLLSQGYPYLHKEEEPRSGGG